MKRINWKKGVRGKYAERYQRGKLTFVNGMDAEAKDQGEAERSARPRAVEAPPPAPIGLFAWLWKWGP